MEEDSLFQRMRRVFQVEEEMDEGTQKEAASLIQNIFRYLDKDARDIMTHRKNIVAIDGEDTLEEAFQFMLGESFSRFPIFHEDIDEIIGFLHLREAAACYMKEELRQVPVKELKEYIRPVTFVPETKSIDVLFKEMQEQKNHVVIVLDEYGQTSGLVAMEDILEEIVGNILDEHDREEETILTLPDGSRFETEEYETVNGFLIDQLDRIPAEDEHCVVEYEGYRFTVLSVENNTIGTVKIEKLPEEC